MGVNHLSDHINELNENIKNYIESQIAYYKLDIFKKMSRTSAMLVKLLVVGGIGLLFLSFFSVAIAILIGESIGALSLGYFIVAAFYALVVLYFLTLGKNFFDKLILQKLSKEFFNDDNLKQTVDQALEKELSQTKEKEL
ncbi:phage holin family protein [Mesonia sediminis]|uniref:Phage holin family protein n=1 Tax=Mesonia sediminis TaxID=1703946 RepID=A0ABW5SER2_9FLAO